MNEQQQQKLDEILKKHEYKSNLVIADIAGRSERVSLSSGRGIMLYCQRVEDE